MFHQTVTRTSKMDSTPRLVAVSGDLSRKSIKQLQDAITRYDQLIRDEIHWRYEVLGSVELSPAWQRYCDERHVYRTELWTRCPHLGPLALTCCPELDASTIATSSVGRPCFRNDLRGPDEW